MNTTTIETTVGDIVRAMPACSRIFENLGIDYCCGGKKPLREACRAKGLDAPTVLALLSALDHAPVGKEVYPDAMSLSELCDHIQQVHHEYLREELPRLDYMTRKVLAVHGEHEPRLRELRSLFERFSADMVTHTSEEEALVFPAIRRLETGVGGSGSVSTLPAELAKLEREHESAGAALGQFKALTDHYTPPEWACNTFRALYAGLADLERETHQHVAKENSVLFPRALAAARIAAARNHEKTTSQAH